jgi:hypothetical protein
MTGKTPHEERLGYIRGWRVLVDLLTQNKDLPLPYQGSGIPITFRYLDGEDPAGQMITAARMIPASFTSRIENNGPGYLYLAGCVYGVSVNLVAMRDATCTQAEDGGWRIPDSITAIAPGRPA